MGVPIVYRKSGENVIPTYDYTDIADGTGIVVLYGADQSISGSTTYQLTKNTIGSYNIETSKTSNTTLNFNLSAFNSPRTIKGTATIRFAASLTTATSATSYVILTLQKISGGTTTDIGTASTPTMSTSGTLKTNFNVPISLTTTSFRKNDNLRLKVDIYRFDGVGTFVLAHDPINREGTITPVATYPTRFEVLVPFEIDL